MSHLIWKATRLMQFKLWDLHTFFQDLMQAKQFCDFTIVHLPSLLTECLPLFGRDEPCFGFSPHILWWVCHEVWWELQKGCKSSEEAQERSNNFAFPGIDVANKQMEVSWTGASHTWQTIKVFRTYYPNHENSSEQSSSTGYYSWELCLCGTRLVTWNVLTWRQWFCDGSQWQWHVQLW